MTENFWQRLHKSAVQPVDFSCAESIVHHVDIGYAKSIMVSVDVSCTKSTVQFVHVSPGQLAEWTLIQRRDDGSSWKSSLERISQLLLLHRSMRLSVERISHLSYCYIIDLWGYPEAATKETNTNVRNMYLAKMYKIHTCAIYIYIYFFILFFLLFF